MDRAAQNAGYVGGVRPDPAGDEPVLIELGVDHGRPGDYDAPSGRARSRWSAPVAALLAVLFCVGSSAAPAPAPLRQLLDVPIRPDDSYALIDNGLLLVQTPAAGTITAYDLADGDLRWQAGATAPAYRIRSAGGLVLLRPRSFGAADPGTIALAAETGAARWRHAGTIVSVAGTPLVAVSQIRSLSGTGRRVEGPVVGVDPDTGRTRWSVPVPSTAVWQDLPGTPPRMLLVHDSGTAEVRNLATGALLASVQLPPADYEPGNPVVVGATLVVRHPGTAGNEVTAYDLATLQRRWNRPARWAYEVRSCGRYACLVSRAGVRAIDPVNSLDRWYGSGWRYVEERGAVVLAYGSTGGAADLVGLVDPGTGRVTVDLRSWRPVPGQASADQVLVTRDYDAGTRTVVAVAGPGSARPRLLGDLPQGAGDCRALHGRLVCRSGAGRLMLWSYQDRDAGGH